MAYIGSLSVSSIEEAFGLNDGDLKLVSDTAEPSPFIAKNGWTDIEGIPLRTTRFEVMTGASFGYFASIITKLIGGVFEFTPGGKIFEEHFVHNMARLYNFQFHFDVVAYVNENCRLVRVRTKPMVEKMTDLVLATLCNEKCIGDEVCANYLNGPNKGEYEDFNTQYLAAFRKIDMDLEVTSCSPKWLRQRKEQINA